MGWRPNQDRPVYACSAPDNAPWWLMALWNLTNWFKVNGGISIWCRYDLILYICYFSDFPLTMHLYSQCVLFTPVGKISNCVWKQSLRMGRTAAQHHTRQEFPTQIHILMASSPSKLDCVSFHISVFQFRIPYLLLASLNVGRIVDFEVWWMGESSQWMLGDIFDITVERHLMIHTQIWVLRRRKTAASKCFVLAGSATLPSGGQEWSSAVDKVGREV